jgi:hypothetical protein
VIWAPLRPDTGKPWVKIYPRTVSDAAPTLVGQIRVNKQQGDWLLGIAVQWPVTAMQITGLPEFESPIDLLPGVFIPCLLPLVADRLYTFSGTASLFPVGTTTTIITLLLGR